MAETRDIVIIGGGPGGYVAALRAAQLGRNTLLVEEDRVGGTCMNWGCIPAKFLLHQTGLYRWLRVNTRLSGPLDQVACDWRRVQEDRVKVVDRLVKGTEFLLEKNKVEVVKGRAWLLDGRRVRIASGGEERLIESGRVILATGSRSADLPFLKADGRIVITSREALELDRLPGSLIVVGAGAIGLELGTVYARLGTKVTVLEILPGILPGSDREMATRLERLLKSQGLAIYTRMRIERALETSGGMRLEGTCLKNNASFSYEAERVLLAAGRRANSETYHEGATPVALDRGFVQVDRKMQTSLPGVYAVGDLVGGKLLAHKASHEGLVAAENAAGGNLLADDAALPMAVFTDPEFASVGLTEEEARERGIGLQTGTFSLQANGRALTMDSPEGMVKLIAGPDDALLGAHIIAPGASDMIPELTLAVRLKLKLQDVSSTIHIHPTLSESIVEAALKTKGLALHALNAGRP
ncbi:MAG: dihydrolipoyl dehydrogenase [Candidatus Aminicenantes bacterium RBG_13_63_10]|nr:MAG: dihydrolipoyl dehydrogenase [Candidatus Aminicenantes bacterium RBG_13_63_10]